MLRLIDETYDLLINDFKELLSRLNELDKLEHTVYVEGDYDDGGSCIIPVTINGNGKNFKIKSYDDSYVSEDLNSKFEEKDRDNLADEIFKAVNCEMFLDIKNRCIPLIDALFGIKSVMSSDDEENKQKMYDFGRYLYSRLWDYPFCDDDKRVFGWLCEESVKGYEEKFHEVESVWGTSN